MLLVGDALEMIRLGSAGGVEAVGGVLVATGAGSAGGTDPSAMRRLRKKGQAPLVALPVGETQARERASDNLDED